VRNACCCTYGLINRFHPAGKPRDGCHATPPCRVIATPPVTSATTDRRRVSGAIAAGSFTPWPATRRQAAIDRHLRRPKRPQRKRTQAATAITAPAIVTTIVTFFCAPTCFDVLAAVTPRRSPATGWGCVAPGRLTSKERCVLPALIRINAACAPQPGRRRQDWRPPADQAPRSGCAAPRAR